MNKAERITNVMLETDLDPAAPAPGEQPEESVDFEKWDNAIKSFHELMALDRKKLNTMEELRYAFELRRELARHGKRVKDVESWIPAEHIFGARGETGHGAAYRNMVNKGYSQWATQGKKQLPHNALVGARLPTGETIFFEEPVLRPVKPFPDEPAFEPKKPQEPPL